MRILLAEDNLISQKVACRLLSRLGSTATAVATGQEAIQACASQRYDLVLMDVRMPVMDGLEAASSIKEAHGSESPWIIALTADTTAEAKESCTESGMDDFVSKPIRLPELSAALWRAQAEIAGRGGVGGQRQRPDRGGVAGGSGRRAPEEALTS